MDWSFGKHSVQNLTALVNFERSGKVEYQAVTWVGYIGVLSGMRYTPGRGGFSVTVDERSTPDVLAPLQALARIYEGSALPIGMLARDALGSESTYAGGLKRLAEGPIANTVYFIVGGSGPSEGAVVTRWPTVIGADVWKMPNGPAPWFILETNYDHAKKPGHGDNRRGIATTAMEKMGQQSISGDPEIAYRSLFRVMQTPGNRTSRGVFNEMTVYTIVMSASTGHFSGVTWK